MPPSRPLFRQVVGNTTHAPGSDTLLFRGTPNYEDMTKELQLPMHELTGHQDDDSDTVQQVCDEAMPPPPPAVQAGKP